MAKGTTKSGFEFEIDEKIFNDWDFVTLADTLQHGKATMKEINDLFIITLGEDGMKELKEHIRETHNGIVDAIAMKDEFAEIIASTKAKN